jgi:hypothetical protein|tara:strand:+ start:629 stop:913 length:285 start_codon:yes stop_codon:yes gene_type:complete
MSIKRLRKTKEQATLATMLATIPLADFNSEDLISLIMQFIIETPDDKEGGDYASRAKVKLDALRLLHDIVKNENKENITEELMNILSDEPETEE